MPKTCKKKPKKAKKEFLTQKQQTFLDEYVKDHRERDAAIRAGYKRGSARNTALKLLSTPHIAAKLKAMEGELQTRNNITKDYFIEKCKDIIEGSDSKNSDKIGGLTLLARITGHIKEKQTDTKQVVILQQKGLEEDEPPSVDITP